MMGTRPQTIGYGLTDSPAGLAAWMLGHPGFAHWKYDGTDPEKSRDEVLDDVTLHWLTNSATSSARLYWEYSGRSPALAGPEKTAEISLPVAITVFPGESYQAPVGPARLSQPGLLPRGRQRRSFCSLGAAGAFLRRAARRIQTASARNLVQSRCGQDRRRRVFNHPQLTRRRTGKQEIGKGGR